MSKVQLETVFHVAMSAAEIARASKLVEKIASILDAGIEAQIANGRPPQCMAVRDGFYISACSRQSAIEQGVTPKPGTSVYVLIVPEDSDFGQERIAVLMSRATSGCKDVAIPWEEFEEGGSCA